MDTLVTGTLAQKRQVEDVNKEKSGRKKSRTYDSGYLNFGFTVGDVFAFDALISHFEKYFSDDMEKHNWIRNPFVDNANTPQGFTSLEAEQFIDLSSDLTLKSIYNPDSLISFWAKARSKFPLVGCKALRVLVPFATSYLCEAGFLVVAAIKSKYRSKIDIERDMRVAISSIEPAV